MVLLFEGAEKILLQSLTSEPRMKEQKRNLLEKYLYEFHSGKKRMLTKKDRMDMSIWIAISKKNTDKIIIIGIVAISVLIFCCGGNSNDRY